MAGTDLLLIEVQRLSSRMLELAKAGEWESVEALEARRDGLLKACFEQASGFQEPETALKRVVRILDCDKEILVIGKHDRDQIRQTLARFRRGRTATQAYQSHIR